MKKIVIFCIFIGASIISGCLLTARNNFDKTYFELVDNYISDNTLDNIKTIIDSKNHHKTYELYFSGNTQRITGLIDIKLNYYKYNHNSKSDFDINVDLMSKYWNQINLNTKGITNTYDGKTFINFKKILYGGYINTLLNTTSEKLNNKWIDITDNIKTFDTKNENTKKILSSIYDALYFIKNNNIFKSWLEQDNNNLQLYKVNLDIDKLTTLIEQINDNYWHKKIKKYEISNFLKNLYFQGVLIKYGNSSILKIKNLIINNYIRTLGDISRKSIKINFIDLLDKQNNEIILKYKNNNIVFEIFEENKKIGEIKIGIVLEKNNNILILKLNIDFNSKKNKFILRFKQTIEPIKNLEINKIDKFIKFDDL